MPAVILSILFTALVVLGDLLLAQDEMDHDFDMGAE